MCLMHDSSDICRAQFLYMSHSLHLTTLCALVLSSTLLFIAGPSEPPSLIIIFIIAYILSDPSPAFQLAAAGEESQETRKGAGQNYGGAHVFSYSWGAAKVSSCVGLRSSSKLLKSSSAAVRAVAWCCYWEAKSAEGEGSRTQRAVPQAASNEFMFRADRKDDFAVTHFGLWYSTDSWQCLQIQ